MLETLAILSWVVLTISVVLIISRVFHERDSILASACWASPFPPQRLSVCRCLEIIMTQKRLSLRAPPRKVLLSSKKRRRACTA